MATKTIFKKQIIIKLSTELGVIDTRLGSLDVSEERKARLKKHRKVLVSKSIPRLRRLIDSLQLVVRLFLIEKENSMAEESDVKLGSGCAKVCPNEKCFLAEFQTGSGRCWKCGGSEYIVQSTAIPGKRIRASVAIVGKNTPRRPRAYSSGFNFPELTSG